MQAVYGVTAASKSTTGNPAYTGMNIHQPGISGAGLVLLGSTDPQRHLCLPLRGATDRARPGDVDSAGCRRDRDGHAKPGRSRQQVSGPHNTGLQNV